MTCSECRKELAALGSYEPARLPAPLAEHIGGCRDCRRLLAALELVETGSGLRVEAPSELAESLPQRITSRRRTLPFRKLGLRIGALAAAATLLLVVGSLVVPRAGLRSGRQAQLVEVHLILKAPQAHSVSVVGDWNGWRPGAQPMKNHSGTWVINLSLKRGLDYQYQFLVNNDKFIPNPNAPLKVANGFGGENSVLAT